MNDDRVKRLMDVAGDADRAELAILFNASVSCARTYKDSPTAANKKDWDAARAGLDDAVARLWPRYFDRAETPATFPHRLAVLEYLNEEGWTIKKSTLYNHCRQGKLRPNGQGEFEKPAVDKYARDWLKRKDTGQKKNEEMENLQRSKLQAETRRQDAAARKLEIELAVMEGRYVRREDVELELAGRAVVLSTTLRHMARTGAASWIDLVGGDMARRPELVESLLSAVDRTLNEYASFESFEVVLKSGGDLKQ